MLKIILWILGAIVAIWLCIAIFPIVFAIASFLVALWLIVNVIGIGGVIILGTFAKVVDALTAAPNQSQSLDS